MTDAGFTIRAARLSDLPHLAAVERDAGRRFHAHYGTIPPDDMDEPVLPASILHASFESGFLLIATDEVDLPIGFLAATRLPGGVAFIEEISVALDAQGKGCGSALLSALADLAASHDCDTLALVTNRDTPWNEPFYKGRGFSVRAPAELTPPLLAKYMRDRDGHAYADGRILMTKTL